MAISKKVAAIGAAGIVAIGGAGLYAGSLGLTAAGSLGAGTTTIQASCASAAVITPGASTWNTTDQKYEFSTLKVSYTATGTTCLNQLAKVNIYATTGGAELRTNTSAYAIDATDVTNSYFVVPLASPVDAGIDEAAYNYGLVIQAP